MRVVSVCVYVYYSVSSYPMKVECAIFHKITVSLILGVAIWARPADFKSIRSDFEFKSALSIPNLLLLNSPVA